MVSPISNDKILPQNSERNGATAGKRPSGEQSGATNRPASPPADDRVELSNAGRMSNRETAPTRSSGALNSPAEARDLVMRIREQIEAAGAQAMNSHGRLEAGQTTALLASSAA